MYPTVFIRPRGATKTTKPRGMAHHGHHDHGHHGHGHHGHGHHGHYAGPVVHHHTAVTATGPMVHHNITVTSASPGIVSQPPAHMRIGCGLGVCSLFFLFVGLIVALTGFISGNNVWVTGVALAVMGGVMLIAGMSLYKKGRSQQQQQQVLQQQGGTVFVPGSQPIVYPPQPTGVPVGQPGGYPQPTGVPVGQPGGYPPPTGVPVGQPAGGYPPPTGVPVGQPGGQPMYKPSEEVAYQPQTHPGYQPYPQHYTPMAPYASQTHADDTSPVIPTAPPPAYDDVLGSTQEKDESRL